jgi:hypothetical protein
MVLKLKMRADAVGLDGDREEVGQLRAGALYYVTIEPITIRGASTDA